MMNKKKKEERKNNGRKKCDYLCELGKLFLRFMSLCFRSNLLLQICWWCVVGANVVVAVIVVVADVAVNRLLLLHWNIRCQFH